MTGDVEFKATDYPTTHVSEFKQSVGSNTRSLPLFKGETTAQQHKSQRFLASKQLLQNSPPWRSFCIGVALDLRRQTDR